MVTSASHIRESTRKPTLRKKPVFPVLKPVLTHGLINSTDSKGSVNNSFNQYLIAYLGENTLAKGAGITWTNSSGPSFAYSLPMHPVHTRRDRVASLPPCCLYGAAIQRASPLGPGRALTLPRGWNNADNAALTKKPTAGKGAAWGGGGAGAQALANIMSDKIGDATLGKASRYLGC